jgi:UDPglucose--hexose-1-phosphate uridylyltransferase
VDVNGADVRVDEHLGTVVHIVGGRQRRPNLPTEGCPFCPGGLEAPEPYDVRWFPNRWPAMPDGRCEVILYTPDHEATFGGLGTLRIRKVVDLWAERTAMLGSRDDVDFVLCFENRGADVGATISHPHGQIYAYDHVPRRPAAGLSSKWRPDGGPAELHVTTRGGWRADVPGAPTFPVSVVLAPTSQVPDLATLDDRGRDDLAELLGDVLGKLDRLHGEPLPYMLWVLQRPSDGATWPHAWLRVEIVSPWRAPRVARYVAAAEVACEEYFNPVVPEELAARLRSLVD